MRRIIETGSGPFQWEGRWEYSLRSEGGLIGSIQITRDVGMSAVGYSADGQWRFKKTWFPSEKVTVRPVDFDNEVAVLRARRIEKRAALEFPYGQVYYWKATNFWLNHFSFITRFGDPVLHFRRISNPVTSMVVPKGKSTGVMEVEPSALYLSEISLLMLLGCYLSIIDAI
jgi:hypothetical protein